MANFLCQTLIRTTAVPAYISSAARPSAVRCFSTQPEYGEAAYVKLTPSEMEAKAVEYIEDYIYKVIVKRSRPEWLPFVPGASYWVPPRQNSYGVAEVVQKLANALTDEEHLSLLSMQGWPSSAFYLQSGESFHSDLTRVEVSSTESYPDEEG